MKQVTEAEFTEAMRAAVEERGPGYVYPFHNPNYTTPTGACVYQTPSGEPACIIGLALHNLGVELPDHYKIMSADVLMRSMADVEFPLPVVYAAEYAQARQDAGTTWGEAMNTYLEALADIGEEA